MRVWMAVACMLACASRPADADLVIRNVTVVDVKTGIERPRQSVVIRRDRITEIGTLVRMPKGATVINGAGKFLIPGLWDMHVHLWYRENQFPLYLAAGVTGLRDMGSDLSWVNQWREQIKAGKLLGPKIETCGPAVDGNASEDPKLPVFVVRGPVEARQTFDRLDDLQVDFIKVLSMLPHDAYLALIERARKWYMPVAGHIPEQVTMLEAIDARQKSAEHMSGVLMACSSKEESLRPRKLLAMEKNDREAYREVRERVLASFDQQKADFMIERMARFEMREVPTLVMLRRSMYADADALAVDRRLKTVPTAIRKGWVDPREERKAVTAETAQLNGAEFAKLSTLLLQMKKAGVMVMAGTDTGDPYTFPGSDLHEELALLVKAGLTPLEALRSATLEPAKYLDAEDSLGVVEPKHIADLVLLTADPLLDIRNAAKVSAVILGGKYLSKMQLDGMAGETVKPVVHTRRAAAAKSSGQGGR